MKYKIITIIFFLILISGCSPLSQREEGVARVSLDAGWNFSKSVNDDYENLSAVIFDTVVDLPHTWNAADVLDEEPGYYRGNAWYRKEVKHRPLKGRERLYLEFEAANQEAKIYVNGKQSGIHRGGYTGFRADITDFLEPGSNHFLLEVSVNNEHNVDIPPLSADFTFFGGIYRDAWLVYVPPVHITMDHFGGPGVYWQTPEVNEESAEVNVFGYASNVSEGAIECELVHTIYDPAGKVSATQTIEQTVEVGKNNPLYDMAFTISNPQLWSVENPVTYTLDTELIDAASGEVLDRRISPLGFRYYEFDAEKGFSLNGKPLKIQGISRHQDYPGLGNALSTEHHLKDMQLIKNMGANFLRVAHYPQDQDVLNICDTAGIITSVEIPIVNRITESETFSENCLKMMEEMIWQNYNHPSIIMWTYMNEVLLRLPYSDKDSLATYYKNVAALAAKIEALTREADPYRVTMIPNHGSFDRYNDAGLTQIPMVVGWNLYQGWYGSNMDKFGEFLDEHHERLPDKPLLVTEYGAGHDPRLISKEPKRFDFTADYSMYYHKAYLRNIDERDFVSGGMIWILNDFSSEGRGDAVPHMNNKGICSFDRTPKETYWHYKSHWCQEPFIEIYTPFEGLVCKSDTKAGQATGKINVFTNSSDVRVLLNGEDQGTFGPTDGVIALSLPFRPGMNKVVAEDASATAKAVADLEFIEADRTMKNPDEAFALHISCGDHRMMYDDALDVMWYPDQLYDAGSWGCIGGAPYTVRTRFGRKPSCDHEIFGTQADPVYQTQRVAPEEYRFNLPEGLYEVQLLFSELEADVDTKSLVYNLGDDRITETEDLRVFGVSINGERVIDSMNILLESGPYTALQKSFTANVGHDGELGILFHEIHGNPVISGIVLERVSN